MNQGYVNYVRRIQKRGTKIQQQKFYLRFLFFRCQNFIGVWTCAHNIKIRLILNSKKMQKLSLMIITLLVCYFVPTSSVLKTRHLQSLFSKTITSDPVYQSLPTIQQLSFMIENLQIRQLDQVIAQIHQYNYELSCRDKVLYFNQLVGMIHVGLTKNYMKVTQANGSLPNIKQTIIELYQMNGELEKKAQQLGIFDLNDQIGQTLVELSDNSEYYQDLKIQLDKLRAQIKSREDRIDAFRHQVYQKRDSIQNSNIQLLDLDAKIQQTEEALTILKLRRTLLQEDIIKNQQLIQTYQQQMAQVAIEIKKLESKTSKILDKLSQLKSDSINLRIDIDLLEGKANKYQQDSIILDIYQNKRQISILEEKVKTFNNRVYWINKIQAKLIEWREKQENYYYQCFDGYSTINKNYGYFINGTQLPIYLSNVFGDRVSLPSISYGFDHYFSGKNVFGKEWQSFYGYPFTQREFQGQGLHLRDGFSCLNPSKTVSGNGVITEVRSNYIQVQTARDGLKNLLIGSCSWIEVADQRIKVGQTVYFNGIQKSGKAFELYFASCF